MFAIAKHLISYCQGREFFFKFLLKNSTKKGKPKKAITNLQMPTERNDVCAGRQTALARIALSDSRPASVYESHHNVLSFEYPDCLLFRRQVLQIPLNAPHI